MGKTLLYILTVFSFFTTYGQQNCTAIIDIKHLETIEIYDKPFGKTIHQMKNDSVNEDFLHLKILDQTDKYFYVSINMTERKDSSTGWIKKADYIGAYKRNESFPMTLVLFKNKKPSDKDKITIANWTPTLLTIEKCADNWTFISLQQNGQTLKGWIQSNELCANAYTYCN